MVQVNLTESKKTGDDLGKNSGGGGRPDEGKALLEITDVEVNEDSIFVKSLVLAHETEGNQDKTLSDYFQLSGKLVDKALDLAYATGILSREAFTEAQAVGLEVDIPFDDMEGKRYVTEISHFTNKKGKTYAQTGWAIHDPDDEEAKDFPKYGEAAAGSADKKEPEKKGGAPF